MAQPWYDYRIYEDYGGGPFPGYHNTDVGTPVDTVLTAPLGGTITADEYDPWGGQLTIKTDQPGQIGGYPYYFMIHFDAINPGLNIGQHVNQGDFLGFSGGQNSNAGLPSLPPGYSHHATDRSHSSGPHLDIGVTRSPRGNWDLSKQWSDELVMIARRNHINPNIKPPSSSCVPCGALGPCCPPKVCVGGGVGGVDAQCVDQSAAGVIGNPGSLLPDWLQTPPWQNKEFLSYLARGAFIVLGAGLIVGGGFLLVKSVGDATGITEKVEQTTKRAAAAVATEGASEAGRAASKKASKPQGLKKAA